LNAEPRKSEVVSIIAKLDGSGSNEEWQAMDHLQRIVGEKLPDYFLLEYKKAKHWKKRCSLVFHSLKYAKRSDAAVELGLLALFDRSKAVRYRACMLLAFARDKSALTTLKEALIRLPANSRGDILAAIDAIKSQNHHYFVDRTHSGKMKMNIGS
jgi:hypothetical protein